MSSVPRLAVGTIQPQVNLQPMVWALLDALDHEGVRIQSYLSRACFAPVDAATSITGISPRHLDSWLMSPELCRALFLRSARHSDLAILEGRFDEDATIPGGKLEPLCQWLGVPRLAIVDVSRLADCKLPPRPDRAAAVLLDQVADEREFFRWQTVLEPLWGIPVVGGLGSLPQIRAAVAELRPGESIGRDFCRTLGNNFLRHTSPARLLHLASQGDFSLPQTCDSTTCATCDEDDRGLNGVRIAIAYDDIFHCYFPDALDALEARGAEVRDFSPLRDETLPPDTDIVAIGCGHPERFAAELGQNQCMMLALRGHVCAGKRIYAEGGGLAYLCQSLALPTGELAPMVDIFPAIARPIPTAGDPRPLETPLVCDSWLGRTGAVIRGYLNDAWRLEPVGRLRSLGQAPDCEFPLVLRHQAIGSRMHLNLVAQPQLLGGFLRPCPEALAWAGR
jgi:cobyrinic acid a,c-diamide synthase